MEARVGTCVMMAAKMMEAMMMEAMVMMVIMMMSSGVWKPEFTARTKIT